MSIPGLDVQQIQELFERLECDVHVRLDVGPAATPVTLLTAGGREIDPVAETRALVEQVCGLSDRVRLEIAEHDAPGPFPTTHLADNMRYTGMPWGHELHTLVHGILEAGRTQPSLSAESVARLTAVDHEVALEVFVTPT